MDVSRLFRPKIDNLLIVLGGIRRMFYEIDTSHALDRAALDLFLHNRDAFCDRARKCAQQSAALAAAEARSGSAVATSLHLHSAQPERASIARDLLLQAIRDGKDAHTAIQTLQQYIVQELQYEEQ